MILIAVPSLFRRDVYRSALANIEREIITASSGVECAEQLAAHRPSLLIAECFLPCGGCDGVLDILEQSRSVPRTQVILIAANALGGEGYGLSRFAVADFFGGVPRPAELRKAVDTVLRRIPRRMPRVDADRPFTDDADYRCVPNAGMLLT